MRSVSIITLQEMSIEVQGSFSGVISRYSRIFSHINSRSEKKIALRIFLISCRKVSSSHMPSISRHSDHSTRLVFGLFLHHYSFLIQSLEASAPRRSVCCPSSAEVITHFNDSGLFIFLANSLFTVRFALIILHFKYRITIFARQC